MRPVSGTSLPGVLIGCRSGPKEAVPGRLAMFHDPPLVYHVAMSIRAFLRRLFRPSHEDRSPVRHAGHELADHVRETIGPLAGGGEGGRLTGHSVYGMLENESASDRPDPKGTHS